MHDKIAVTKIEITRCEGRTALCGKKRTFKTFASCALWLKSQASTFPKSGGYDKHDFTVAFADGRTYSGRFDAKPDSDFHLGRRIAQCRAYYVRQGVAEAIAIIDECNLA